MAYRETEQVRQRKNGVRQRILETARGQLAVGGFRAAQMASLARRAGVATGTLYRYFPAKAELYAEVFRVNSQREVDAFADAAAIDGSAAQRLRNAATSFAQRAIKGRRIAYALIAEPVDPLVEAERLVYRRAYAHVLEDLLRAGIRAGEFPRQDVALTASALVGALAEALVGPLAPTHKGEISAPAARKLIQSIVEFCLRATGAGPGGSP